jgi:hypothetical protein
MFVDKERDRIIFLSGNLDHWYLTPMNGMQSATSVGESGASQEQDIEPRLVIYTVGNEYPMDGRHCATSSGESCALKRLDNWAH